MFTNNNNNYYNNIHVVSLAITHICVSDLSEFWHIPVIHPAAFMPLNKSDNSGCATCL